MRDLYDGLLPRTGASGSYTEDPSFAGSLAAPTLQHADMSTTSPPDKLSRHTLVRRDTSSKLTLGLALGFGGTALLLTAFTFFLFGFYFGRRRAMRSRQDNLTGLSLPPSRPRSHLRSPKPRVASEYSYGGATTTDIDNSTIAGNGYHLSFLPANSPGTAAQMPASSPAVQLPNTSHPPQEFGYGGYSNPYTSRRQAAETGSVTGSAVGSIAGSASGVGTSTPATGYLSPPSVGRPNSHSVYVEMPNHRNTSDPSGPRNPGDHAQGPQIGRIQGNDYYQYPWDTPQPTPSPPALGAGAQLGSNLQVAGTGTSAGGSSRASHSVYVEMPGRQTSSVPAPPVPTLDAGAQEGPSTSFPSTLYNPYDQANNVSTSSSLQAGASVNRAPTTSKPPSYSVSESSSGVSGPEQGRPRVFGPKSPLYAQLPPTSPPTTGLKGASLATISEKS